MIFAFAGNALGIVSRKLKICGVCGFRMRKKQYAKNCGEP
jgi:hypothetical protein